MMLSVIVLERPLGDPAGSGQSDMTRRGLHPSGEWVSCVIGPSPGGSAAAKNRACRTATGEWLLFLDGAGELPDLTPFQDALQADVVCTPPSHDCLDLRPPFALRRSLFEALQGFRDLPGEAEDVELGLRLQEAGARILHAPGWNVGCRARRLEFTTVLALFCRHPGEPVLRWACDQSGAPGPPEETLEARFLRTFGRPVPAQGRHSRMELAQHFAERSDPPLLPAERIHGLLETAEATGLYGCGPAGDRRFERSHAANWLIANSPYFEAMVERNLCLQFPPPRLRDGTQAEPLAVTIDGRYEVHLEPDCLAGLRDSSLSLPLPVECCEQRNLELFDFEPPEFRDHLGAAGTTACLPLRPQPGEPMRIGYSFRCTVREGVGGGPEPTAPLPPLPLSASYEAKIASILGSIFGRAGYDPVPRLRARRIYDWLLEHIAFRWSERAGLVALDAWAGNCAHRIRLFTLLCHRAGLRVRERCGILAGDLHSHGQSDGVRWATTARADRGTPLFHVWAEVFLDDEGWLPLDLFGADSGQRMMTPRNVRNPATRARLHAWSPRLDDYYFGRVDPYRLYFGLTPQTLSGIPTGVPGTDLEAIWKLAWGTRHSLRTRLSGLPPNRPEATQ